MAEDNTSPEQIPSRVSKLPRLLVAFESPAYRRLWVALFFYAMAMGMRMLSQGWLVLDLTDSPFWVGLVTGVEGVATVSFGAPAGALVDRWDRRKVLAAVQSANGVLVIVVGVLALTHHLALWHLLLAAVGFGTVQAVQLPAANAMVYEAVGPRRLLNAVAARMIAMNITRIIGSLIAGLLISAYGAGASFLFAGTTVFVGIFCLLSIKGTFLPQVAKTSLWRSVREGLTHAWQHRDIRRLLLLSLLMETFGFSHFVMLPVMARDVLHVDARGLGLLSAASGVGATVSNLVIAGLGDYRGKAGLLGLTALATGVALVCFAFSPWFGLSVLLVGLVGAALMAYDVTMNTMLQLLATDDMRGRVMGLYALTFGFTPLGGFLQGSIAAVASAPVALGVGGAVMAVYVGALLKPLLRIRTGSQVTKG